LTHPSNSRIEFISAAEESKNLSTHEIHEIKSLVKHSSHPLSQLIFSELSGDGDLQTLDFKEYAGKGIEGQVQGHHIKIGSLAFVNEEVQINLSHSHTRVFIRYNGRYRGFFNIANIYREGLKDVISALQKEYDVSLLSGDTDSEKHHLLKIFNNDKYLHFHQTPYDKLMYIKKLQSKSQLVAMIGDGLNDAGALKQSDVGISISDDVNSFTPASDAILDARQFKILPDFIEFAKDSLTIIIISFIISLLYNIIGLSFAVQGILSPIIAAILMPISSISVVLFTTGVTTLLAKRKRLVISSKNNILDVNGD
jgi:Cu+-exporting ATPase